jgi:hypothetical protein
MPSNLCEIQQCCQQDGQRDGTCWVGSHQSCAVKVGADSTPAFGAGRSYLIICIAQTKIRWAMGACTARIPQQQLMLYNGWRKVCAWVPSVYMSVPPDNCRGREAEGVRRGCGEWRRTWGGWRRQDKQRGLYFLASC